MTDILPWAPGAGMRYPAGTGIMPWTPQLGDLMARGSGAPRMMGQFALPPPSAIGSLTPYIAPPTYAPGASMSAVRGPTSSVAGQSALRAAAAQQAGLGAALARGGESAIPGAGTAAARAATSGAAPTAARGGLGGLLAGFRQPGAWKGLLSKGNLARGLGWGLAGALGGNLAGGLAGQLGASEGVSSDVGRTVGYGLMGAGLGALGGPFAPITAPMGAALGAGVGALGFIPGIENLPVIGGLWGGKEGDSNDDVVRDIRDRTNNVLLSMGADQSFLNRAYRQFDIALTVQGAKRGEGGKWDYGDLKAADISTIGTSILEGMIQQFGMEQQNQQSQQGLGQNYDQALAEIMSVQAWMQPLLQEQLGKAQWYADQYANAGRAAAAQITDPALAAAGAALAGQYSSDQASSNALALQQIMYQPQAWRSMLEQQYNEQALALQQQQMELQQMQAGNPNLAPGLYPVS